MSHPPAATLPCPTCGFPNTAPYGHPRTLGDAIYRRRKCLGCRRHFLTADRVVSGADLAALAEDLGVD